MENKIKLLFVCHGNICRSPMAEFIMKKIVEDTGMNSKFEIASAATSRGEIGSSVYPGASIELSKRGISCKGKIARQIRKSDFHYYDKIIVMDNMNLKNIKPFADNSTIEKVSMLMDYTDTPKEIADPWYTDDFQTTGIEISRGCEGLFKQCVLELSEL